MIVVYLLSDPITETIRYIGQTRDPEARYRQHIRTFGSQCNPAKSAWIDIVLRQGLYPLMSVFGIFESGHAWDMEMLLIAAMAPRGHLTNQRQPTEREHQRRLRRYGVTDQWLEHDDEWIRVTQPDRAARPLSAPVSG
jgi:hypothetical protein